jgi:hypothetical protein
MGKGFVYPGGPELRRFFHHFQHFILEMRNFRGTFFFSKIDSDMYQTTRSRRENSSTRTAVKPGKKKYYRKTYLLSVDKNKFKKTSNNLLKNNNNNKA